MKKLVRKSVISIISIFVMTMTVLAGCGNKQQQTATCTLKDPDSGLINEMILEAEGDTVTKLTQTNTVSLEGWTEEQLAYLDENVKAIEEQYNEIEGTQYTSSVTGTEFKEIIEIAMDNKDTLKAVTEKGLLPVEGSTERISFESTKKNLTDLGWTVE